MIHKCTLILTICTTLILCQFDFGHDFGFPIKPFASMGMNMGAPFGDFMKSFEDMDKQISKEIESHVKPMKISQTRRSMTKGFGGVTLMQMGAKTLIIKEGTVFQCLGQVSTTKPFCSGQMRRFQIQNQQDYCYSNHYSQIGDFLCIAHTEQHGIKFVNNNGNYKCSGSDERPALLINLQSYKQLCGRLPWEIIYKYYPNVQDPFHVQLPNPDLPCLEKRPDVCIFYGKHGGDLFG